MEIIIFAALFLGGVIFTLGYIVGCIVGYGLGTAEQETLVRWGP